MPITQKTIHLLSKDINDTDNDDLTLLYWSIKLERHDITLELLARDALDINAKDKQGRTLLHLLAAQSKPIEITIIEKLKTLTALKRTINDLDQYQETPLTIAIQQENIDKAFISMLLELDADYHNKIQTIDGTPSIFEYAIQNQKALDQLIEKTAASGDINILEKLISEQNKVSILLSAAAAGNQKTVNWLLEKAYLTKEEVKSQTDNKGHTAFLLAARNGHIPFVEWLRKNKFITVQDIQSKSNRKNCTALLLAARNGDIPFVAWLLNNKFITVQDIQSQTDYEYNTALLLAARNGHIPFVAWLLNNNLITDEDIQSQKDWEYNTALLFAARNGDIPFVEWLHSNNLITDQDIQLKSNREYRTALLLAARNGDIPFVEWLLNNNFITVQDIQSQKDYLENTTLFLAALFLHNSFVEWLRNNNLITDQDILKIYPNGHTIFQVLALHKQTEVVIKDLLVALYPKTDNKQEIINFLINIFKTHNKLDKCIQMDTNDRFVQMAVSQLIHTTLEKPFQNAAETVAIINQCFQLLPDEVNQEQLLVKHLENYQRAQNFNEAKKLALEILQNKDFSKSTIDSTSFNMAMMIYGGDVTLTDDAAQNTSDMQKTIAAYQFLLGNDLPEAKALIPAFDKLFSKYTYQGLYEGTHQEIPVWTTQAFLLLTQFYNDKTNIFMPYENFKKLWQQCVEKQKSLYLECKMILCAQKQNLPSPQEGTIMQTPGWSPVFWENHRQQTTTPATSSNSLTNEATLPQRPR